MTGLLDGPSWYDVLGVKADATSAEVRRAHRELVAELEKDRSRESRERLAEAEAAFAVLRDPGRRKAHDRILEGDLRFLGETHDEEPGKARGSDEDACRICGRGPTARAPLFRVTGAVLLWVKTRTDGPLCRSCGLTVFRAFQNHSLAAGWWGILAVFFNAWALIRNARSRRVFAALDPPEDGAPAPSDSPEPLDPSPALAKRAGLWVAAALGIALVAAIALLLIAPWSGFSTDPADYIPEKVGDQDVDPTSAFAQSVTKALEDPSVESVESGTVGGGGTGTEALPSIILAAAKTKDPENTRERLQEDLTALEGKVETRDVEGVEVQVFDIQSRQGGTGISFAFSSPNGTILLWSIAFRGGTDAAVEGMKAMLQSGKK